MMFMRPPPTALDSEVEQHCSMSLSINCPPFFSHLPNVEPGCILRTSHLLPSFLDAGELPWPHAA